MVPIFKKGDRLKPSNYRLIALLDLEAKAYARLLLKDLEKWAEEKSIILLYKTGFRSQSSTMDNVLALAHLSAQVTLKNQPPLFCCFVDYSTAFDKVVRKRLWWKLENWGIPSNLLKAIRSLYEDTWVRVKTSA